MDDYELLRAAVDPAFEGALATVAAVSGHAYRKAGAIMLLHADGRAVGSISPGCLESDLQARAAAIVERGEPEVVAYNLRPDEDAIWGGEVGCGGAIDVLLEPAVGELRTALAAAFDLVKRGEAARLVRRRQDGRIRYTVEPVRLIEPSGSGGQRTMGASREFGEERQNGAKIDGRQDRLPQTLLLPRPRLIVFGAGADSRPIREAAGRVGFRVTVADWREGLLPMKASEGEPEIEAEPRRETRSETRNETRSESGSESRSETRNESRSETRIESRSETRNETGSETRSETRSEAGSEPVIVPETSALMTGDAAAFASRLAVGPGDYVLICSHNTRKDREMLEAVLPLNPAYIGILGSAKRIALLADGLRLTPAVHAPVGLPIGAEGPDEIALSIAAELVAVKSARRASMRREGERYADRGNLSRGGLRLAHGHAEARR